VDAEDVRLLTLSAHAIRLFCFAYLFRWFVVMTQSLLSAIEKPLQATLMSLGVALVFPVLLLGALWQLGLDGIWLNFVGVNAMATVFSGVLLWRLGREIAARERAAVATVE
jgi:Na+-driven multidrug efflux pump